jgi:Chitobiase/beta-hexosaminidase C-terminal domain/PQQ enzyme repeat
MKSQYSFRQSSSIFATALVFFAAIYLTGQAGAQSQNVLTQHNDLNRDGANTNEVILTSANVNSTDFGKLFTESLDGNVYAEPLYVQGLNISGSTHNVVFVCTENNSVYAFDADSGGSALWHVNLGTPGSSTTIGCSDLTPNIGITGTPVIDLHNNTMYLDALTVSGSTYTHSLYALNITNGNENFGGPKTISASLSGQTFDALIERQRPGLLLLNGVVYIGFGSYCDDNAYHGWLLGYNETNLSQVSSYIVTPNGSQGAIWSSGMAPAADSSGNIYIMTANGTFDANSSGSDYGESFLKLSTSSGLSVADWFTPSDYATLNANDTDLGSGGPVLLPGGYVVGVGKDGNMYLCNQNNFGHYNSSKNACLQSFSATAATDTVGTSPVYWQGPTKKYLFLWSGNNNAVAYQFTGTNVNTTAVGTGSVAQDDRVGGISLSADGNTNGILWGDYDGNVLYAYDADNFPTVLWNSSQNSSRDSLGSYNKFTSPMIANGKVYMGTASALVVYGLLNNTVAAPTFSPGGGTYSSAQSVTISTSTSGASINYTTDGSTPSPTHGTAYSSPVNISSTTTLQAIAFKSGMNNSTVTSATYVFNTGGTGGSVLLDFNTSGEYTGNFVNPDITTASCTETNAGGVTNSGAILVTGADGNSTYYNGSWNFSTNTAFVNVSIMGLIKQASSAADKWQIGIVGSTNTGFAGAATGDGWAFGSFRLVPQSTTSPTYQLVYQTATNGTTSTANVGSVITLTVGHWYQFNTFFTNTGSGTSFNMASSLIDYGTTGATAGSDLFTFSTLESITGTQAAISSYIVYPCFRVADDTGVSILDNFNVEGVGTNSSSGSSGVAAPTFSPAGGTYTSSQSVTISTTTSGASINYTVDGSQPTQSNGTSYSSPVNISSTTTLKAIAFLGTTNSTITDETYLFGSSTNLFEEAESLTVGTNSSGTTVTTISDPNLSGGEGVQLSASATNAFMVLEVTGVQAGTYDVRIGLKDNSNEGIFQLATSATLVGGYFSHGSPVDQYSATATYPEVDIGNVLFGSAGTKYFMFTVTGQNASSSGFNQSIDYIKMLQQ